MITCLNPEDFLAFTQVVGASALFLSDHHAVVGPLLWIFDGVEWCLKPVTSA